MYRDILERLRIDPGQRTLGQLIQDREAAAQEIARLRGERAERPRSATSKKGVPPPPATREEDGRRPTFRAGTLIRVAEVCELLGISRAMVYKLRSDGAFPEPVRLGERTVRWNVDDLLTWCDGLRR